MGLIISILLNGLSVYLCAFIINSAFAAEKVRVKNYIAAIVVSVIIGILNMLVRPVLNIIALPINLITLGLFRFVINGLIILLVPYVVNIVDPGAFYVDGLIVAMLFSAMVSFLQSTFGVLVK
jgi:putative membrane protein